MSHWKIHPRWFYLAGAGVLAACGGAPAAVSAPRLDPTASTAPTVELTPPALDLAPSGASPVNLRAWVDLLAAPEFEGRASGSPGEQRVAAVLADYLAGIGWSGAMPDGGYYQPFDEGGTRDQNVVARLAPDRAGARIIVLGAHYDGQGHCGRSGEICPSADDNASGVAALLEVARILAGRTSSHAPRKTEVVIALFGAEERGVVGSRHFVGHPPIAMDRVSRMVNLDMVGRQLLDGQTVRLLLGNPTDTLGYIVGAREADASRAALFGASEKTGTRVLGVPESWLRRAGFSSDSVPFSDVVPTLFLSTSIHDDYHKPGDVPGKVDVGQIGRAVGLVLGLVLAG